MRRGGAASHRLPLYIVSTSLWPPALLHARWLLGLSQLSSETLARVRVCVCVCVCV